MISANDSMAVMTTSPLPTATNLSRKCSASSPSSWHSAWVLANPTVTAPIIGACSKIEHLQDLRSTR